MSTDSAHEPFPWLEALGGLVLIFAVPVLAIIGLVLAFGSVGWLVGAVAAATPHADLAGSAILVASAVALIIAGVAAALVHWARMTAEAKWAVAGVGLLLLIVLTPGGLSKCAWSSDSEQDAEQIDTHIRP